MFTGIIEETGTIIIRKLNQDGMELSIHAKKVLKDLKRMFLPKFMVEEQGIEKENYWTNKKKVKHVQSNLVELKYLKKLSLEF